VILVDTSVAVPAALPWHASHQAASASLPRQKTQAIAQVAVETYSVLTRLPSPQRVPAAVVLKYLYGVFEFPPLVLTAKGHQRLLELAAANGISGGAVYDAIVAATAVEAGATLLTLDRRALATYRLLGVSYRLIG